MQRKTEKHIGLIEMKETGISHYYNTMVTQTSDLMAIIDQGYIYRAANPAYLQAFKKTQEEVVGHPMTDVLGQQQFEKIGKTGIDRSFTGEELIYQAWIDCPGIGVRFMDIYCAPVLGTGGKVSYCATTLRDITERKQREEELQQQAVVFQQAHEAILIADASKRIIRVNQAFSDITGYSEQEVLGSTPRVLSSERDDNVFYEEFYSTLEKNGSWQGEFWNRRRSGEVFPVWTSITAVKNENGEVFRYINIFSDISEHKLDDDRIRFLAHHDVLTGLPNRFLFNVLCVHAFNRAQRNSSNVAILFLDLDRFKIVNDNFGHSVGDDLLKLVAERLKEQIRLEDTVARLGGDEFAIILENVTHSENAELVASNIIKAVNLPFEINGHLINIGTSIGISIFPEDGQDATILVDNADKAMYRAKENGRNNFKLFSSN